MPLQRLSGGEQYPQDRAVIVDTGAIARPAVEVVEQVTVVETGGDGPPVVEVGEPGATGAVLHVVEPVYVSAEGLQITLDELADVTAPATTPAGVSLLLQRGTDGTYALIQQPPIEVPPQAYRHDQIVATTLWQIRHNLGYRPGGVQVTDYDGTGIEPDKITRPLPNIVEVTFGVPVAGIAWLS